MIGVCAIVPFLFPPSAPTVRQTASGWEVSGPWGRKTFRGSEGSAARPFVDLGVRRVVVPSEEGIVVLDFEGRRVWQLRTDGLYDPRPMLRLGPTIVAGIGQTVTNQGVSRTRGDDVVLNLRDGPENVCVRVSTGRVVWRQSELVGGTVLGTTDGRTIFCVKIDNPKDYFTGGSPCRLSFDQRLASTGRRIRSWKLKRVPEALAGTWGDPPGPPASSFIRINRRDGRIVVSPIGRIQGFGPAFDGDIVLGPGRLAKVVAR